MWTSSTATPAATGGASRRGEDERKHEHRAQPLAAGRERARADRGDEARVGARPRARARSSSSARYASSPACADDLERASRPRHRRVQRDDAAAEQPVAHVARSRRARSAPTAPRAREAPHARGQVRVRLAAGEHLAGERHERVEPEPEERPQRARAARDLEHREPAAGPQDARSSRRPPSRSARLRTPKPTVAASNSPSRERQGERVALHPLDRAATCARARSSIGSEKSSPTTRPPRRSACDREVARCRSTRRARGRPATRPPRRRAGASAGRARRSSRGSSTS